MIEENKSIAPGLPQKDMDYVATIVLLFPDKVFHVRSLICENHMPHLILSCGLLKRMLKIKNPLDSEEKADL